MPLPPEAEAVREELERAYREVQAQQIAELERIAGDPNQRRYRARLEEQGRAVAQALDEVDVQARQWASTRLPEVYQFGAMEAAEATGRPYAWTQIHREAVAEIASDTYRDLLASSQFVRRDVKRFVREAVRARVNYAVIGGETSTQAARRLTRDLRERGVKGVRYSNGALHTIEDYADTVLRTQVAKAHNFGVLNHGRASGVRYARASDGLDCGLQSHQGSPKVAGMVFPLDTALSYPSSHPRCARSWSLEPLIRTDADAAAARQYTPEEQEHLALEERERARTRTVTGRLNQRERARRARLRARQERLRAG